MKNLWKSLVARLTYWLIPKPDEILKPGDCECGHSRCYHKKGKGECMAGFPPDAETPYWTDCGCQVFILDDDDDGGEDEPETPSPEELEKLYQK